MLRFISTSSQWEYKSQPSQQWQEELCWMWEWTYQYFARSFICLFNREWTTVWTWQQLPHIILQLFLKITLFHITHCSHHWEWCFCGCRSLSVYILVCSMVNEGGGHWLCHGMGLSHHSHVVICDDWNGIVTNKEWHTPVQHRGLHCCSLLPVLHTDAGEGENLSSELFWNQWLSVHSTSTMSSFRSPPLDHHIWSKPIWCDEISNKSVGQSRIPTTDQAMHMLLENHDGNDCSTTRPLSVLGWLQTITCPSITHERQRERR